MDANSFKKILGTFADSPADMDLSRGKLIVQVRDELIEADISLDSGYLWVAEGDQRMLAASWIISRVARVPLLADRILDYVTEPEHFVGPSGTVIDQPDFQSDAAAVAVDDAVAATQRLLDRKLVGATAVTYLTSDAGEGKTTVINYMARQQAQRYKNKTSDWLLVPITLGGRTFLRFDDVVVAALVNRLRFQLLYFDSFLELVKLGAIVPAFDGFEEMLVESSSGEALSALGQLVRSLSSSGAILVAARKAYFEYQSIDTQTRLLDGMGGEAVSFARVGLDRWDRSEFLEYAGKRGTPNAAGVYEAVVARLGESHPLVTRAVLVRRLIDVAVGGASIEELVKRLGEAPQDYFFQFVNAIVDREATEKWLDRSGEPRSPLLSAAEHHDLLAMVAQEMWLASTETLKGELLDVVADLYSDQTGRAPVIARQISERLKQHSLLTSVGGARGSFAFDHEDFYRFYLGEALGRVVARGEPQEVKRFLQPAGIDAVTAEAASHYVARTGADVRRIVTALATIGGAEARTSFTKENAGLIALRLSASAGVDSVELPQLAFPRDSLRGLLIEGMKFANCHFQPTSLESTTLRKCVFRGCRFERVELCASTSIEDTRLIDCDIGSVALTDQEEILFEPDAMMQALTGAGVTVHAPVMAPRKPALSEEARLIERAIRVFLRANQINENVLRQKLARRASLFFDRVLPELLKAGVFEEVPYKGAGVQRRFRLAVRMQTVTDAILTSDGTLEGVLERLQHRVSED